MARCKSCGAEIRWIRMESGKLMPVDPGQNRYDCMIIEGGPGEPDNIETCVTGDGKVYRGVIMNDPDDPNYPDTVIGYRPHWATCPHADQHRRRTGR